MKRLIALLITITILAAAAAPTFAQRRSRQVYYDPSVSRVDNSQVYYDYSYRDRSFWARHRDKVTLGIGTAGGAAIGGLIGGKRGSAIGALSGLGASALYTYKFRNRRIRF
ncbi:MAG: hypothetical protein QOK48_792 [Blastocatellia bacterium]|nr:hypothetical protein [Blastocatellia bacterium]